MSFNGTGKQVVPFDLGGGNSDLAAAVAVQADGKIVLVGSADRAAGNVDFAVTRLNRDGSLDATFGTGGKQTVGFDLGGINEDRATAVAVQADGKVVAGDSANRGGVRLAVKDLDGDGRADLVAGSGPGGGSRVTAYAGRAVATNGTPPELFAFDAQPGFAGGVFVG